MPRDDLVLETERLRLRPFVESDLDDLARINADPRTMRHLVGSGAPMDRAATWRALALYAGHIEMRGYGILAVVDKSSGVLLGRSGPWFPLGWPMLEVGWVTDPQRWGEGIATEAAAASLRFSRDRLGAEQACSIIRPSNAASIRVAVKLGARLDRVLPDFFGSPAELYVHTL